MAMSWEWVRDWYGEYTSGVFVDPLGPSSGKCTFSDDACRVVRGGSFDNSPEYLRSAVRGVVHPELRARYDGFRCVRVPPALTR